jgi:hypothetical protein
MIVKTSSTESSYNLKLKKLKENTFKELCEVSKLKC